MTYLLMRKPCISFGAAFFTGTSRAGYSYMKKKRREKH